MLIGVLVNKLQFVSCNQTAAYSSSLRNSLRQTHVNWMVFFLKHSERVVNFNVHAVNTGVCVQARIQLQHLCPYLSPLCRGTHTRDNVICCELSWPLVYCPQATVVCVRIFHTAFLHSKKLLQIATTPTLNNVLDLWFRGLKAPRLFFPHLFFRQNTCFTVWETESWWQFALHHPIQEEQKMGSF